MSVKKPKKALVTLLDDLSAEEERKFCIAFTFCVFILTQSIYLTTVFFVTMSSFGDRNFVVVALEKKRTRHPT